MSKSKKQKESTVHFGSIQSSSQPNEPKSKPFFDLVDCFAEKNTVWYKLVAIIIILFFSGLFLAAIAIYSNGSVPIDYGSDNTIQIITPNKYVPVIYFTDNI